MSVPKLLFHLAEESNLASIVKFGLLSTERLTSLAGIAADDRAEFLCRHRPDCVTLPNGVLIRDQKPMPPAALAPALRDGLTPGEWYAHLNRFVFLWSDRARLERQRSACGLRKQAVLVFDGARVLADFAAFARVSPINSGNARRRASRRGLDTLTDYTSWLRNGWSEDRARNHRKPVEYLFACAIPAHPPHLLDIERDRQAVDAGQLCPPAARI